MTVLNTVKLYMITNVLIQNYVLVIKYTLETVVFVDETKYKIHGRDSTIYRVLRLSENTVVVEPDDGAGVSRTLNRQHVIKCNVSQCEDRNFSDSDSRVTVQKLCLCPGEQND